MVKALSMNKTYINQCDSLSNTALHLALLRNYSGIANYLLAIGAKVNTLNSRRWTPLHCAAKVCNFSIIKQLAAKGINISARDSLKNTALSYVESYLLEYNFNQELFNIM